MINIFLSHSIFVLLKFKKRIVLKFIVSKVSLMIMYIQYTHANAISEYNLLNESYFKFTHGDMRMYRYSASIDLASARQQFVSK